MNRSDAIVMLSVAAVIIGVSALLFKEFRVVSFDGEFAQSEGWPVSKIDLMMMTLVVIVTVVGLQAVGLLLIIALLVIPPAGARFWTERLSAMVLGSALIGGLSGYIGSSASALLPRLPAGAVIVLVAGGIFFTSFLFAPSRGVFARAFSQLRMTLRIAEDHFLREMYELYETQGVEQERPAIFVELRRIPVSHGWSWLHRFLILGLLRRRGLIGIKESDRQVSVRLTQDGLAQARLKVRNHRLWEEYLVTQMELPVSHVDYSADLVEHALSPQLVSQLQESLDRRHAVPDQDRPPPSLHPLGQEN